MLCLYNLNQSFHQVTSRRSRHSDLSWNLKNSYDTESAYTEHILSRDSSSSSNFDSIFKSTLIAFINLLHESDLHQSIHQASAEHMSLLSSWASTSQDIRWQRNQLSIKMIKTQAHAEHMTSMHQRIEQEKRKRKKLQMKKKLTELQIKNTELEFEL